MELNAVNLKTKGYIKLSAIGYPTKKIAVSDALQASREMLSYLHPDPYTWLGGSELKKGCGDLIEDGGKKIGRVSQNGKVWDLANNLLFDPYACE